MTRVDTSSAAVEVLARIIGGRAPNNSKHDQVRSAMTLEALLAERDELRQALEQARDAALEEAAKIVDPAANAKRGLWAENLRRKAAAIRALQSTTTKEEE